MNLSTISLADESASVSLTSPLDSSDGRWKRIYLFDCVCRA